MKALFDTDSDSGVRNVSGGGKFIVSILSFREKISKLLGKNFCVVNVAEKMLQSFL